MNHGKTNEIIALIDCNNFYVSCEQVFNPHLKGKPVVVLSNNDGCIVSRSNEAKQLKIPIGAPGFKYETLIRKNGGTLLSSNYSLYADMSNRVMQTLSLFTPEIEYYSIDEAFLNLGGFRIRNLDDYSHKIRNTVIKWTGIPVSVGISTTKTLAKIANYHAKRIADLKGVYVMLKRDRIDEALERVAVGDVWGIGKQYDKFLKQNKIETAYQLKNTDEKFIDHYLTSVGHKTVLELNGYACIDLDDAPTAKKSIVTSRSFGKQVSDLAELEEAVSCYITRSAEKLRAQGSVCGYMMVFLNTNRFKDGPQYNNSASTTFLPPTAYTPEMVKQGLELLGEIYLQGFEYKKTGVMLADIIAEEDVPRNIIETSYLDDHRYKLMETVDKINRHLGHDTIFLASSGTGRLWEMKRAKLSPKYTTRWSDLPKVK